MPQPNRRGNILIRHGNRSDSRFKRNGTRDYGVCQQDPSKNLTDRSDLKNRIVRRRLRAIFGKHTKVADPAKFLVDNSDANTLHRTGIQQRLSKFRNFLRMPIRFIRKNGILESLTCEKAGHHGYQNSRVGPGNRCPIGFARNSPVGGFAEQVPNNYSPLIGY